MKKLLWLSALVLLFACGEEGTVTTPQTDNTQLNELKSENILLRNEAARKDSMINAYALYVNEIHENLALISGEERIVRAQQEEGGLGELDSESAIAEHITTISELMAKNEARIAQLKKDIKASNLELGEFEKMVISLSEEVATKNMEIFALQQELENIDAAYSELFVALDEKQDVIDKQKEELNMAWYAMGSDKELKDNGVITKEGGLLGIGRTNKLKADLNHEYFTEIDITEVTELPLGSKSAELLTSHPVGSYEIKGGDKSAEQLVILNPEQFWSVSKYLVIILD